jgi:hypothetical protein
LAKKAQRFSVAMNELILEKNWEVFTHKTQQGQEEE